MLAVFILLLFGWLCCFLGRRDPSSLVYFATASGLVYLAFFAYMRLWLLFSRSICRLFFEWLVASYVYSVTGRSFSFGFLLGRSFLLITVPRPLLPLFRDLSLGDPYFCISLLTCTLDSDMFTPSPFLLLAYLAQIKRSVSFECVVHCSNLDAPAFFLDLTALWPSGGDWSFALFLVILAMHLVVFSFLVYCSLLLCLVSSVAPSKVVSCMTICC